jgi:energy-coupling factor transporter ATP-binding protein EcfA2
LTLFRYTPQPIPEPAPPPERPSREDRLASIPTPKTLVAYLDQYVIGQAVAKKRLALGVSNHFKRLVDACDRDAPDPIIADADLRDVVVEKSNILLIGASGSGKTHLVKSLASHLNVPLAIGDATSLTETGYVGEDVESLLCKLVQAAEGDIEVAQRGIVYIDEVDKIQRSGTAGKDMRLGVQHALLKMLEGCIATVPPAGGCSPVSPSTQRTSCSSAAGRLRGSKTSPWSVGRGLCSGSMPSSAKIDTFPTSDSHRPRSKPTPFAPTVRKVAEIVSQKTVTKMKVAQPVITQL